MAGYGFHGGDLMSEKLDKFYVKGKRNVKENYETDQPADEFCVHHQFLGEEEGVKEYKCLGHKLEGIGELVGGTHGNPDRANMFWVYEASEECQNRWDTTMAPEKFCEKSRKAEEGEGDSMFKKGAHENGYVCLGHDDIGTGMITHHKPDCDGP
eukprot:GHVN01075140.1.p1 GENE.GHVN01075140.1~~GHVN01075140.1.p1  ORF type:complete len:154 (-),score=32.71 GHVN01075140.1:303-764(-)